MAKWGEGDPRWIVEERPDATNVNNWHWTEKNASPWSIEKLKELFKNIPINFQSANITIDEIEKCDGEASVNNRKGKLIFFYEWDLVIKWSGRLENNLDKIYTGKIKIPNLSEENDVSEMDIQFSVKEENEESIKLKELMSKFGKDIVKQQLTKYISLLKEEFSQGMILPKKDEVKTDTIKNLSSGFNTKINMIPVINDTNKQSVGLKLDVRTLNVTEKFQCRANEFYNALTKIEMVTAFTRGFVKMEVCKGGKFELFNGNITGKFIDVIPGKKIVQLWRCKQWPEGHYSTVTFNINEMNDHTEVNLIQTNVPSSEMDITKNNWQKYYWDAIKIAFGFGSFII